LRPAFFIDLFAIESDLVRSPQLFEYALDHLKHILENLSSFTLQSKTASSPLAFRHRLAAASLTALFLPRTSALKLSPAAATSPRAILHERFAISPWNACGWSS
jgi:hypothetical protein